MWKDLSGKRGTKTKNRNNRKQLMSVSGKSVDEANRQRLNQKKLRPPCGQACSCDRDSATTSDSGLKMLHKGEAASECTWGCV